MVFLATNSLEIYLAWIEIYVSAIDHACECYTLPYIFFSFNSR